jgi:type 1 glutamine amidotransferase
MRFRIAFAVSATVLAAWGSAMSQDAPKPVKPKRTPEEEAERKVIMDKMRDRRLAEEIQKVEAALPDKPAVAPQKPRKLLVFSSVGGKKSQYSPVPLGAKTFELLGRKTGAYEPVLGDDPLVFEPGKLKDFDAVLLNNVTGDFLPQESQRKSLIDFVKSGKGVAGIHGAAAASAKWPEYVEMIGAFSSGHPFTSAVVKLDDPASPLNAAFEGKGFEIRDEIFTFKEPYSRDKLRILLSVDFDKSDEARQNAEKQATSDKWKPRGDKDYALSWIREYGQGRVFYGSFGNVHSIYWNPAILRHYLAGIQYALGDMKADATPSAKK